MDKVFFVKQVLALLTTTHQKRVVLLRRLLDGSDLDPRLHTQELIDAAKHILDEYFSESAITQVINGHDISLLHLKSFQMELKEYVEEYIGSLSQPLQKQQDRFTWLASEAALESLCKLLKTYGLIDSEMHLYQVLKGDQSNSVTWLKTNRMLAYLIQRLVTENYLEDFNMSWKIASQSFVKKSGQSYTAKDLSEANRNNTNPRGAPLLEDILDKIQKLASLGQG